MVLTICLQEPMLSDHSLEESRMTGNLRGTVKADLSRSVTLGCCLDLSLLWAQAGTCRADKVVKLQQYSTGSQNHTDVLAPVDASIGLLSVQQDIA